MLKECPSFDVLKMSGDKLSESDSVNEDESNLCFLEGTKLQLQPDADVADLFKRFNKQFFWDQLKYVEVRWSPRMTLCAGLCVYDRRPGYCSIRLSKPLLILRGKVDLVETLLHEMIHAYLFVTENNRDQDGHGPEFLKHMDRINKEVGLNISVYHTFDKEVRHYQQHVWLCNGPCQLRPPFFGKVYRSMNRNPGPSDIWWDEHDISCGGSFSKISEPSGYQPLKKKPIGKKKELSTVKSKDIRSFFNPVIELPSNKIHNKKDICAFFKNTSGIQGCGETSKSMNIEKRKGSAVTSSEVDSVEHVSNGVSSKDATPEQIKISSKESASEDEDDAGDGSLFDFFGSIFNMPFRFLKRRAEEPDPRTIKVRKPDLSAISKSKRGMLKSLIKVPDQPTLDSFFNKRISSGSAKKSSTGAS